MTTGMSDAPTHGCLTCMDSRRVMVGMSYPPGKTIGVHFEYEPCPDCTKGTHSFWARRTAQIIKDTRARRGAQ